MFYALYIAVHNVVQSDFGVNIIKHLQNHIDMLVQHLIAVL